MVPKSFTDAHYDVYEAKHGNATILIGHDPAMNWSVLKNGACVEIDQVVTLREALCAGHRIFDDGEDSCPIKLIWRLIPGTKTERGGCPDCGRYDLEDDDNQMWCPHCGWDLQYTDEEKAIKKQLKANKGID
jgi:hypothetical protein